MTISKEVAIKEAREVWGQPIVVVESDQVKLCEFANRVYQLGAATKELEVGAHKCKRCGGSGIVPIGDGYSVDPCPVCKVTGGSPLSQDGGKQTCAGTASHQISNEALDKLLAAKDLEVVRLREALECAMTICDAVPTKAHVNSTDDSLRYLGKLVNQGYGCLGYYAKIRDALSTPPSTADLDAYVAEMVRPLEEEIHNLKWALGIEGYENLATPEQQIGIITDLTADLAAAEDRVRELEKDIAWRSINTASLTDDLIWLYDGIDSIEGPRTLETDDYDRYRFWAPCTWPSTRPIDAAIERSE